MTWRITIEWTFISPVLRSAAGTLHLEKHRDGMAVMTPSISHSWEVTIKDGSSGQRGFIPALSEEVKTIIDTMVKTYFDGMNLEEKSFNWINVDDIYERSEDNWMIDYMI